MKKREKTKKRRKFGETVAKLLYPPRCPFCDKILPLWSKKEEEAFVCEACARKLPGLSEPICMKCGKPVHDEWTEYCMECRRIKHVFDRGWAVFAYRGMLRHSIYRLKAQNRRDYLDFYGAALEKRFWEIAGSSNESLVIVPLPMHWRKKARRGYNQSELLAKRLAALTGLPLDTRLLRCIRYTRNQKELDQGERRWNVQGSMAVQTGTLPPKRVLLIDDIYTTGSTIDEAARALKLAGTKEVYFLVLCTTV